MFSTFRIAGSGLTAQRFRMDVIAGNIANAETTRTPEGGPYRRTRVTFTPLRQVETSWLARTPSEPLIGLTEPPAGGVAVTALSVDPAAPRLVYDPTHPDAGADGYVAFPSIDLVTEMTDMLSASRAYEAGVTTLNVAKSMAAKALEIGKF